MKQSNASETRKGIIPNIGIQGFRIKVSSWLKDITLLSTRPWSSGTTSFPSRGRRVAAQLITKMCLFCEAENRQVLRSLSAK
ncbi:MAG: hypothetical protein ACKESB_01670 [Candidatus Hodgkinia cicadicola]